MDRSDRFPRSRLGLALRKAAEASAPTEIDFAAVYARAGRQSARAANGKHGQRPLFLSAFIGAAAVAAVAAGLALAIGLDAFGRRASSGPIGLSMGPAHAAGEAAAELFALEAGYDPSPAALREDKAFAALLDERSLEMDMSSFVADVWEETEL